MKRLFIHAGMPKCGTSALQVFLAKNPDLLTANGIDYPRLSDLSKAESGEITSGNAGPLARSMYPAKHPGRIGDKDKLFEDLLAAIKDSRCENILISSELFMMDPLAELTRFKSRLEFSDIRVTYTYYVRRQDQSILSAYMQRVKRHGYSSYPVEHVKKVYRKANLLNYHSTAKKFEGIFGPGNVVPLCYEDSKHHQNGIVGHFLSRIFSKEPEGITIPDIVNVSPSPLELKFQLMANVYSPKAKLSDLLVKNSAIAGRGGIHKRHSLIPNELIKEVMNYFTTENDKLESEYGITFPELEWAEYVDIRNMDMDVNELMSIFIGLLVALDKKIPERKK